MRPFRGKALRGGAYSIFFPIWRHLLLQDLYLSSAKTFAFTIAAFFANLPNGLIREKGGIGTAIGDKGYRSSQVRERLERAGLRFITPARTGMKNRNTEEEKGPFRKRNLVERVVGKLKRLVGDNFLRFRARETVPLPLRS
ncbi:MAG: transposase [Puniceicoccales bacterium]|jgi:hypothetical protein|nr:transposase [Puniceicoccales bacterium]